MRHRAERTILRPRRRAQRTLAALALSLGLVATASPGCIAGERLVAKDGSHRLRAADAQSGITVILTTEAWDGDIDLGNRATIVHVLIANQGTAPVLLAPGDFTLTDIRGFEYSLYDAGGSFTALGPGEQWRPRQGGYDPGSAREYISLYGVGSDVSSAALPWGVLLPGTQMRGYLYFQDLRDAGGYEAHLVWHAQTPEHAGIADFDFELHLAKVPRRAL